MTLSTGRQIHTQFGAIGIDENFQPSKGFDTMLLEAFVQNPRDWDPRWWNEEGFTKTEKIELADRMIERWKEYKQKVSES